MCWSWQVSLIFSVMDLLCILYLYHRNWFNDRWICYVGISIFMQEFSQFFLWFFVLNEDNATYESLTSCSSSNQMLSGLTFLFVRLIPVTHSYNVYKFTLNNKLFFWSVFIFAIIWFMITICKVYIYEKLILLIPLCSIIWSDGHIYWKHPWNGMITKRLYNLPALISFFTLYKPKWVVLIPWIPSMILFLIFKISNPYTAHSIWCWSGFAILMQQVFVNPMIFKYIIGNRVKYDHWFLKGTERILCKYKIA